MIEKKLKYIIGFILVIILLLILSEIYNFTKNRYDCYNIKSKESLTQCLSGNTISNKDKLLYLRHNLKYIDIDRTLWQYDELANIDAIGIKGKIKDVTIDRNNINEIVRSCWKYNSKCFYIYLEDNKFNDHELINVYEYYLDNHPKKICKKHNDYLIYLELVTKLDQKDKYVHMFNKCDLN